MKNNRYNDYKSYKNSYPNNAYKKPKSKAGKIAWFWIAVILMTTTLLGLIYFSTGAFHADNLQSWQVKSAYFNPWNYKVYSDNENCLISTEYYSVRDAGKTLQVSLDAGEVDVNERKSVSYTIVYYSGDVCVGYKDVGTLDRDIEGGQVDVMTVWSFNEVKDKKFYAKDENGADITDKSYVVDSIRIAVRYIGMSGKISLAQRSDFTSAVYILYV
jgi:hypothetical protein